MVIIMKSGKRVAEAVSDSEDGRALDVGMLALIIAAALRQIFTLTPTNARLRSCPWSANPLLRAAALATAPSTLKASEGKWP